MFRKFENIKNRSAQLTTIFIIICILFLGPATINAAAIVDIESSSNYAKDAIIALSKQKIITGNESNYFNPHKHITRCEMIAMIVNALHIDTENVPVQPTFQDVPNTHWAYKYVEAAYRERIIQGISKELFGKDEICTREQMITILLNSIGLSNIGTFPMQDSNLIGSLGDKDKISPWAENTIEFSLDYGLMKGIGNNLFAPKDGTEKQQVAFLLYRILNEQKDIIAFAKNQLQPTNYLDLYEALKSEDMHKYAFSMNSAMVLNDITFGKNTTAAVRSNGSINGADRQMEMVFSMNPPDSEQFSLSAEVILLDDKVYLKEDDSGGWIKLASAELDNILALGMFPGDLQKINAQLIDVYHIAPIKKIGEIDIDEVHTTKYTMSLDNEILGNLVANGLLEINDDFQMVLDGVPLDFEIEFYLNDSNRIIKEIINLNSDFEEGGEEYTLNINIDIDFKNIDTDIKILKPSHIIEEISIIPVSGNL